MVVKDFSAFFLSQAKWQQALESLQEPGCPWTHVRLFHNDGVQTEQFLTALELNTSVDKLFIGDLDLRGATALASFLPSSTTVRYLEVQKLADAAAMGGLAQGLRGNSSVLELRLPKVSDSASMALLTAELASRKAGLHLLDMPECDPDLVTLLCVAALSHQTLQALSLPNCKLEDTHLLAILQPTAPPSPKAPLAPPPPLPEAPLFSHLQNLDLSNNLLAADGMEAVQKLLTPGGQLQRLVLNDNPTVGLGEGPRWLGEGLAGCSSLQKLEVGSCGIDPSGCTALAAGLSQNSSLQELNLDSNHIGAEGLLALLAAMHSPGVCQLRLLRVSHNNANFRSLPPTAPLSLAGTFTSPLFWLDLSHTPVGDAGLFVMLPILSGASTLEHLILSHCSVGDKGAENLVAFLSSKPKLRTLNLEGNRIRNPGGQTLLAAVPNHEGLTSFSVEENGVTDSDLKSELLTLSLDIGGRLYVAATSAAPAPATAPASTSASAIGMGSLHIADTGAAPAPAPAPPNAPAPPPASVSPI